MNIAREVTPAPPLRLLVTITSSRRADCQHLTGTRAIALRGTGLLRLPARDPLLGNGRYIRAYAVSFDVIGPTGYDEYGD